MRVLITGGAGFVGSNLVDALASQGHQVRVFDNLSRPGAQRNAEWLADRYGDDLRIITGDIRDADAIRRVAEGVDLFYHLAGQVAVTTSVHDPRLDFEINALGTLNALEAARALTPPPIFVLTSTNKVYGGMEDVAVANRGARYEFEDLPHGIPESRPLDFHSPYGCSKGAADQYVRDYARIYGLPTVVFRMSCIYGPRQFGNEDQGWVAHFVISALQRRPLTIYGDGMQVRDVLYVDDLVRAFQEVAQQIERTAGQVYNIGGGPVNTISLLELLDLLERQTGRRPAIEFGPWRPGDQPVYVSDIRKAERDFDWQPRVGREEGIRRLIDWAAEQGMGMPQRHGEHGEGVVAGKRGRGA